MFVETAEFHKVLSMFPAPDLLPGNIIHQDFINADAARRVTTCRREAVVKQELGAANDYLVFAARHSQGRKPLPHRPLPAAFSARTSGPEPEEFRRLSSDPRPVY